MTKARKAYIKLKNLGIIFGLYRIQEGKNISILSANMPENKILNVVFHKKKRKFFIEGYSEEGNIYTKEEIKTLLEEV